MRLSTFLRLCLAAAALVPASVTAWATPTAVAHAHPRAHAAPRAADASCAAGGRDFPLTTRIHGGPRSYRAGGGHGTWFLDLRNTTARTCDDVHPVLVLVDDNRDLRASQVRLEFHTEGRSRPVRLETTDRDELVGVFDADEPGLTLGPRRTRTVRVRLSVTSDAAANEVTATAAVVQRRGDDGDWIGRSNPYRFRIAPAGTPHLPDGTGTEGGTESGNEAGTGTGEGSRTGEGAGTGPDTTGLPPREDESASPTAPGVPPPGELAVTGVARVRTALAVAALLAALGCTLVHVRRRHWP